MVEVTNMLDNAENMFSCDANVWKLGGNCWCEGWENILC